MKENATQMPHGAVYPVLFGVFGNSGVMYLVVCLFAVLFTVLIIDGQPIAIDVMNTRAKAEASIEGPMIPH